MGKLERKARDISYLLRMIQVLHEVDSVEKVHRMLLSLATSSALVGCRRAMLFQPDPRGGDLRGLAGCRAISPGSGEGFEAAARRVFENFENAAATDLSLQVRSFTVPADHLASALVKAHRSGYPVLAEGRASEFADDPFFSYFATTSYLATPLRVGTQVRVVMTADNEGEPLEGEQISLLLSLVQQAALALDHLAERADHRRRAATLAKVSKVLHRKEEGERERREQVLALTCRALEATGGLLKDYTGGRGIHLRTLSGCDPGPAQEGDEVEQALDELMDLCAASGRALRDDRSHPDLSTAARERLDSFLLQPVMGDEGPLAVVGVYRVRQPGREARPFAAADQGFLETVAAALAWELASKELHSRVVRSEDMVEELRSFLVKQSREARLGQRGLAMARELRQRLSLLAGEGTAKREELEKLRGLVEEFLEESERERGNFRMVDLFALAGQKIRSWSRDLRARGIDVELEVEKGTCPMLLDAESIAAALEALLDAVGANLSPGDRVLAEVYKDDQRAFIVVADNGRGMPGEVLSRLFMPFLARKQGGEKRRALSLVADVVHLHGGEIRVKSSQSWKTILVLSLPLAANRDRRKGKDRRMAHRGT